LKIKNKLYHKRRLTTYLWPIPTNITIIYFITIIWPVHNNQLCLFTGSPKLTYLSNCLILPKGVEYKDLVTISIRTNILYYNSDKKDTPYTFRQSYIFGPANIHVKDRTIRSIMISHWRYRLFLSIVFGIMHNLWEHNTFTFGKQ